MSKRPRTVLVLGATGAIGRTFVGHALRERPDWSLVAWVRPPSLHKLAAIADRLEVRAVDVARPAPNDWPARLDAVVNCMGSNYVAGDAAEFWRIDHAAPLALAAEGKRRGCETFVLLSALGAHARSPFVFLRTKGVLARDLAALGLTHLHIVTPPFVVDSTVPRAWYERLVLAANLRLAPLLRGPLAPLRPVTRADVAAELVRVLDRCFE